MEHDRPDIGEYSYVELQNTLRMEYGIRPQHVRRTGWFQEGMRKSAVNVCTNT